VYIETIRENRAHCGEDLMMQNVFKELGALLAGLLSRGMGLMKLDQAAHTNIHKVIASFLSFRRRTGLLEGHAKL